MKYFMIICSAWFVLVSGNAMGQDQTPDDTTPVELEESEVISELVFDDEVVIDNNSVESPQDGEAESTERFIPTEQISQDLGVSFPANI